MFNIFNIYLNILIEAEQILPAIFVQTFKTNQMKTKKIIISSIVGLFLITFGFANNGDKEKNSEVNKNSTKEIHMNTPTIVGVAAANEDFTTLVAAVQAADLVETLNSQGPFTVFAPVNAAFSKLPNGAVDNLLKPQSKEALTALLTYHVVSGEFKAAAVIDAIKTNDGSFVIETVNGDNLTASLENGKVILTDANGNKSTVVIADVAASNGVIHAIDTVLLPK